MQRTTIQDQDLTRRAMAAWFRSGETITPSSASDVVSVAERSYVHLVNTSGTLAVYRVRTVNGSFALKRLKRWPATLDVVGAEAADALAQIQREPASSERAARAAVVVKMDQGLRRFERTMARARKAFGIPPDQDVPLV